MRVIFAGTPEIAVPSLRAVAGEHEIVAVLTNPDRAKGRGKKMHFSPVKEAAIQLGLNVLQPQKLNAEFRETAAALKPDILICIAYGKIFGPAFLALFPEGGINLHPSRLPDLRGPSPLNSIILRGDEEGAITVQTLAKEMDSGDILLQKSLIIDERETAETLTERVALEGGYCLIEVLKGLEDGSIVPRAQDHSKATFCSLIGKNDGLMDWSLSAAELDRVVRGYTPWPHGFTFWNGLRLNIIEAHPYTKEASGTVPGEVTGMDKKEGILIQTGEGILAVSRLQLQSKKAMDYKSFLNGSKDFIASVLGAEHDLEN
ncbi:MULTISPECIES: methionyl-tRNA formyltransferase [unclassified Oceanispirochaeta]|uniref:methionyl-tRNA formyltransferase n=1 Tax=unclassified Oceanispirochaeta TaxID=2635722 RepID=UPI000E09C41B|nr:MULTISPECIES: methionyl-tRNA formyltransferase [unclassified Oceanispirochaeta]MBF9016230.1 methionyl-tRNA formyltransferase [Oceanispirochaeta sp. M2]NPD72692.1 methionyl-tRNA formyltransferase [Oceanispirochaeta sp. M1]RDG31841.1 methionyl-tRNA formyltransferase [Oceanispirochaeta sp. M1]